MDHEFWHQAWAKSDNPGWQQATANAALDDYWQADGSVVFVPMCGRSPDLQWLHDKGHHVIGIDLSESAVRQFFEHRAIEYEVEEDGEFLVYSAMRYRLYVGDYFELCEQHLETVGRVYDRAALVAMPEDKRIQYASHLQTIVPDNAEIFAVLIHYEQSKMNGPPFSVTELEVNRHFSARFAVEILGTYNDSMKRRGLDQLTETVYRLTPLAAAG